MADYEKIKSQIQTLINKANETTGNSDTNLTDGVNALVNGFGKGGSAEIPTCTVEFVIGESAYYTGNYAYTKCENGVISTISAEYEDYQYEGAKFTFNNVVCGSIIHFDWSYDWENATAGDIWVNGNASLIQTADVSANETCTFSAQLEPNTVSTITVTGIWIDDGGGWE